MRHYAKLQGYRLSDNGLEDKTRRPLLPPCHTEADVFARLGLAWREPYDRELPVTPAVAEVGRIDEFGLLVHDEESSPHGRGGEAFAGVDAEDETAITAMLLRQ